MQKKIIKKTAIMALLFIMLMQINVFAEYEANLSFEYIKENQKELESTPEIGCKAAYLAEPITGKVIYEKNAHEPLFPASTTKILTALVAMENCQITDTAVVSQHALDLVPEGYSNAKMQAGEVFTIKDLLYALLLPSANEAANVLAEHVSGSVEEFVELCNKRAEELGCENLHFVNTNGMHDDNHYCSAYDLYLVAKECRKFDIFNEIVKTKTYTLPSTDIYPESREIKNTNELLYFGTYYYPYCTGIKTGHTTPAGECLVASSSFNNLDLISVVLGGKQVNSVGQNDRFYDTKRLFEYTYDNYSIKTIANQGDSALKFTIGKATKETAELDAIVDTDIATIVPNYIDKDNIESEVILKEDIVAPIEQNEVLGQITYHADGINYTTNIIASHNVEKLPYAKYNAIVVAALIITLIVFTIVLKLCKKHRIIVLLIEIILVVLAVLFIYPQVKKDVENKITKVTPKENVTIENNYYKSDAL